MPSHNKAKGRGQPRGGQSGGNPRNVPAAEPQITRDAPAIEPQQKSFDGPNDTPSRGRTESSAGPSVRGSSRPASQTRTASRTRVDPARNPPAAPVLARNVDFGGQAYDILSTMPTTLAKRENKFGNKGKKTLIEINSHAVLSWPQKTVYQYDIIIGSGAENRGLIKALYHSKPVQEQLGKGGFIFDGNKIGWSPFDLPEVRVLVDLDAEKPKKEKKEPPKDPRPKKPSDKKPHDPRENKHMFRMVKSKHIHLSVVRDYLDGKTDFNTGILETINFLDHLLRETPSKNLINLRRSYFSRVGASQDRSLLGGGVEAMRGIYQTIRVAEGKKLVVNVDVSNSCFWHESLISQIGFELNGGKGNEDQSKFLAQCLPDRNGQPGRAIQMLKRLQKNKFIVKHRGQGEGAATKQWTIMKISNKNAKTHTFKAWDIQKNQEVDTSVFDYYFRKYSIRLDKWQLPLLETQKKDVLFPMELAIMAPAQRYPFKLNETQTSGMIKFAVARPPQRRKGIESGLALLKWQDDLFLKGYGLKIDQQMLKTQARILDPPEVAFGKGGTAKPMFSGRWDLRGKVFLKPNNAPLISWGIVVLNSGKDRSCVQTDPLNAFVKQFINLYRGHGGRVTQPNPHITTGIDDTAQAIADCFSSTGNKFNHRPQMIMVILPAKSSEIYQRVKKSCDCRFGVMSQCVQSANVVKNQPQYCSNVLMKFNCKLGGTTSNIKVRTPYFNGKTMIIGADVSHAAPGLQQASMAAMTVSLDATCSRYGAAVQSNGHRVEMISTKNIKGMLWELVSTWVSTVGGGSLPDHVYYFRDGVSEGQYIPLLKWEVADIKAVIAEVGANQKREPKFTVVVAEKRHHIRFFPPPGPAADKNQNPVPGIIVDRDVTSAFENDIYLCSHAAIQGTARPTHYTIILDEMKVPADVFQCMLYEHCYQYQRATTPVSLFPAVYYAHLASKRAESHIDMASNEKALLQHERLKKPGMEVQSHSDEMGSMSEWPALLPWQTSAGVHLGMWYI